MAMSAHDGVAVTCSAVAPFVVTWASEGWLQLCCFSEGEVVGNTLTLIQGPATNLELLKTMMASIKAGVAPNGELTLINYDKYLRHRIVPAAPSSPSKPPTPRPPPAAPEFSCYCRRA